MIQPLKDYYPIAEYSESDLFNNIYMIQNMILSVFRYWMMQVMLTKGYDDIWYLSCNFGRLVMLSIIQWSLITSVFNKNFFEITILPLSLTAKASLAIILFTTPMNRSHFCSKTLK